MSVEAIRLKNFRGIENASIQLKPLTVLLGPNSAGKSTFGHALAAMAHAHRLYRNTLDSTSLTPEPEDADKWPVDLGLTRDLRRNGAEGPVLIELQTSGGSVEFGFGLDPTLPDLCLSYLAYPSGESEDISLPAPDKVQKPIETIPEDQRSAVGSISSKVVKNLPTVPDVRMIKVQRKNEKQWQENGAAVFVPIEGLVPKEVRHASGTARVLSGRARADVKSLLDNLTYLRATRRRPSRAYEKTKGKWQPIGYEGEWTPRILLDNAEEYVEYRDPPIIPTTPDESQLSEHKWQRNRELMPEAVARWLTSLGLASKVESVELPRDSQLLQLRVQLAAQLPHDITEVGFGVSQVLPIVVAGLMQQKDSLYIVDLPEAHLHPRPQAELADFFCSLAMSGRSSLIETHSEMFFHRLRLRAEMTPDLMENIAVYFIDEPKNGKCSEPRPVGLTFDEEPDWPTGFLHEGWEAAIQIGKVRRARIKQRK